VTDTRLLLALVTLAVVAGVVAPLRADGPGWFPRKPKVEPARVRQWVEIVRSEADEMKRRAAILELSAVDPRVHTEVIPALVAALRQDPSAAVRAAAAEAIGRCPVVFPLAGLALETANEIDPVPAVREAARQALWQYHLIGYRTARSIGERVVQTAEPPFARPARPRLPVVAEPPTAPTAPAVPALPPVLSPPAPDSLPPLGMPPGPRLLTSRVPLGPLSRVPAPVHTPLTVEPPLARPAPLATGAAPTVPGSSTSEPPLARPAPVLSSVSLPAFDPPRTLPRWPEHVPVGPTPPLALDLPPLVPPP
jgi:hypothetical protein